MKTLGIVTEYNPFHKGHAYMIEEAKKKAAAACGRMHRTVKGPAPGGAVPAGR